MPSHSPTQRKHLLQPLHDLKGYIQEILPLNHHQVHQTLQPDKWTNIIWADIILDISAKISQIIMTFDQNTSNKVCIISVLYPTHPSAQVTPARTVCPDAAGSVISTDARNSTSPKFVIWSAVGLAGHWAVGEKSKLARWFSIDGYYLTDTLRVQGLEIEIALKTRKDVLQVEQCILINKMLINNQDSNSWIDRIVYWKKMLNFFNYSNTSFEKPHKTQRGNFCERNSPRHCGQASSSQT